MRFSDVPTRLFRRTSFLAAVLASSSAHAASVAWPDYWAQVRQSDPRIRSLESDVTATREQVALPVAPPMISLGSMGMNGPLSDVMEQTFEVSQKLPFPSRFGTAGDVRREKVAARESASREAVARLKRELHRDFVTLASLAQERALLRERAEFYSAHLKRLRAYTLSEQMQQLHILEMEAEIRAIAGEERANRAEADGARARLAAALASDEGRWEGEPRLEALDLGESRPAPRAEDSLAFRSALAQARVAERERALARTQWLPDLALTYRRRVRKDNVMPSSHEVVVGLELPFLLGWQPAAQSREAGARAEQASLEARRAALESRAEIASLTERVAGLREQLRIQREDILPNLDRRAKLLHRLAQTDLQSLDQHRATFEQVLNGRSKTIQLERDYRIARFDLDTQTETRP